MTKQLNNNKNPKSCRRKGGNIIRVEMSPYLFFFNKYLYSAFCVSIILRALQILSYLILTTTPLVLFLLLDETSKGQRG